MGYEQIILVLIGLIERVSEGIKSAAEIIELQKKGGHMPPELIEKAHVARKLAEASMDAMR